MPSSQQAAPWVFYGSLGLIVLIPFLFRTTATFLVNLIGFIYPTFASVVAIQKKEDRRVGQWLVYWVVYASLLIFQRVFDVVLSKIPFYPLFNALFLIALMHYPFGDHDTLAQYLYYMFFAPNFGKVALEANDALMEAAGEMKNDPQGFAGSLINGNDNKEKGNLNCLDGQSKETAELMSALRGMEDEEDDNVTSLTGRKCKKNQDKSIEIADASQAVDELIQNVNEIPSAGPGQLSKMIRPSESAPTDENNNQGSVSGPSDADSAARINLYRKSAGARNAEKLNSSKEVLTMSSSTDELEEVVDILDEEEEEEAEKMKVAENKKEL